MKNETVDLFHGLKSSIFDVISVLSGKHVYFCFISILFDLASSDFGRVRVRMPSL